MKKKFTTRKTILIAFVFMLLNSATQAAVVTNWNTRLSVNEASRAPFTLFGIEIDFDDGTASGPLNLTGNDLTGYLGDTGGGNRLSTPLTYVGGYAGTGVSVQNFSISYVLDVVNPSDPYVGFLFGNVDVHFQAIYDADNETFSIGIDPNQTQIALDLSNYLGYDYTAGISVSEMLGMTSPYTLDLSKAVVNTQVGELHSLIAMRAYTAAPLPLPLTWTGAENGNWSKLAQDANWTDNPGSIAAITQFTNNTVIFDNTAAAKTVIVSADGVSPADMTVSGSGYQFSGGTISGSGKLTINESATFNNQFDFAGGSTFASGKVLTINTISDWPFTTDLSGDGSLTKTGAGTLTLSGANTYTGNTTVSGGTLSLESNLTNSDVILSSGTSLETAAVAVKSLTANSSAITPTGTLSVTNAASFNGATIDLSGNLGVNNISAAGTVNFVTNNTTIKLGDLSNVASSAAYSLMTGTSISTLDKTKADVTLGNHRGGLYLADGDTRLLYGLITDNTDLNWTGIGGTDWNTIEINENWSTGNFSTYFKMDDAVIFDGSYTMPGAVSVDVAGVTVANMSVFGSGYKFSGGAITGSGTLTISESATLNNRFDFTGEVSLAKGTITIASGSILKSNDKVYVGAAAGDVALLTGNGSVSAADVIVCSTGTLSPDDNMAGSIGVLPITGNLSLQTDATLKIDIAPSDASDKILVSSGTVTFDKNIVIDLNDKMSGSYTLITAANGFNGFDADNFIITLNGGLFPVDIPKKLTIEGHNLVLTIGKDVSALTIEQIADQTYTGSNIEPLPVIMDGTTILKKDTDYTLLYSNNKYVGTATITITGKGNYIGTRTVDFTINKAAAVAPTSLPEGLEATYGDRFRDVSLPSGFYWPNPSSAVGNASSLPVTVRAFYNPDPRNYENYEAELQMMIRKALPTKEVIFPTMNSTSEIVYDPNRTLGDISLNNGSGAGSFFWRYQNTVPTVDVTQYEVVFIPFDGNNYDYSGMEGWNSRSGTIIRKISLTIAPREIAISLQCDELKTYTGEPLEMCDAEIVISELRSSTATAIALKYEYYRNGQLQDEVIYAGAYEVIAHSADVNYTGESDPFNFIIEKAQPIINMNDMTVIYKGEPVEIECEITGTHRAPDLIHTVIFTYEGINTTVYGPTREAPTEIGEYSVHAVTAESMNHLPAEARATLKIVSGVDIDQIDADSFRLYPNPVFKNASLFLEIGNRNDEKENCVVEVYDTNGRLLRKMPIREQKTEIRAESKEGVYLYVLRSDAGIRRAAKVVVK